MFHVKHGDRSPSIERMGWAKLSGPDLPSKSYCLRKITGLVPMGPTRLSGAPKYGYGNSLNEDNSPKPPCVWADLPDFCLGRAAPGARDHFPRLCCGAGWSNETVHRFG